MHRPYPARHFLYLVALVAEGVGFRVRVWGLGFRLQGLGFRA